VISLLTRPAAILRKNAMDLPYSMYLLDFRLHPLMGFFLDDRASF
jgi:hypothetical protein